MDNYTTMMPIVPIHRVSANLLKFSIDTKTACSYEDAEKMVKPKIEATGVSEVERAILDDMVRKEEYYCIDAEVMMKSLGLTDKSDSRDIRRTIERAGIIPSKEDMPAGISSNKKTNDKNEEPPAGGSSKKKTGNKLEDMEASISSNGDDYTMIDISDPYEIRFQNDDCRILWLSVKNKNGRTYHPIKFIITIEACHKLLMRSYNEDKYANYFSLQLRLIAQYKEYQSNYRDYLNELEKQHLSSENIDLKDLMLEMRDMVKDVKQQNKEIKQEAHEAKEETKKTREEAKFNLAEMKKSFKQEIGHVADLLKEKCITSTMDPKQLGLRSNFMVMGYKTRNKKTKKITYHLTHTAGQNKNVRKVMREKMNDPDHKWVPYIQMHYNANSITLRNNIKIKVEAWLDSKLIDANLKEEQRVIDYNNELQKEIMKYNDEHRDDADFAYRSFVAEKYIFKPWTKDTFPIICKCNNSTFTENDYIDFDEYLDVMRSVDVETKTSPYTPETSDDSE